MQHSALEQLIESPQHEQAFHFLWIVDDRVDYGCNVFQIASRSNKTPLVSRGSLLAQNAENTSKLTAFVQKSRARNPKLTPD